MPKNEAKSAYPGAKGLEPPLMCPWPPEGQYRAQTDETCNLIAKRFGVNAQAIVKLNKERYPGLRPHAKLLAETIILLPKLAKATAAAVVEVLASEDKTAGKRRRTNTDAGNPLGLKQDGQWPIEVGSMMSTPVRPGVRMRATRPRMHVHSSVLLACSARQWKVLLRSVTSAPLGRRDY